MCHISNVWFVLWGTELLLLATWGSPRLLGPIVASWLRAVCFSGSLISLEEKRMSTSEHSSAGSQDRIKWSPLLHRELLLHLHQAAPPSQDDYFWQCLSQEGTFADLMGPGPLYAAFWMAPCHHLWTERKKKWTEDVVWSEFQTRALCLSDPECRQYIFRSDVTAGGGDELHLYLMFNSVFTVEPLHRQLRANLRWSKWRCRGIHTRHRHKQDGQNTKQREKKEKTKKTNNLSIRWFYIFQQHRTKTIGSSSINKKCRRQIVKCLI